MMNPYLQNQTNTYSSQDLITEPDRNRSIHPKGRHQAHANTGDDTSSNHKRAIISDERKQNTANGCCHDDGDDNRQSIDAGRLCARVLDGLKIERKIIPDNLESNIEKRVH